jgi:abhydrolase domain-containing protein 6
VIHGEKDRLIHPSTGRELAKRLPNARLERLDGIGHVPMIEAPKRTAQLIEQFLRTVG